MDQDLESLMRSSEEGGPNLGHSMLSGNTINYRPLKETINALAESADPSERLNQKVQNQKNMPHKTTIPDADETNMLSNTQSDIETKRIINAIDKNTGGIGMFEKANQSQAQNNFNNYN